MTKDEANEAYRQLAEWSGSHIVLMAREPGKQDRILFASDNEGESRAVCYPALQALINRARRV